MRRVRPVMFGTGLLRLLSFVSLTGLTGLLLGCPDFAIETSQTRQQGPGAPALDAPLAGSQDPILQRLASKPLRYTRHGRCRMACRHISEEEVREILDTGEIAPNRTRNNGRCISYAVEGHTDDGQDVRIVYGDCERDTRVITTIDLSHDWPCSCR